MSRSPKAPIPIADLVFRFLAQREGGQGGGARESVALKVLSAFRRIGPPVTEHAEAMQFRRGVLTLAVGESAWLTELTFLRPQIIRRLNALVGLDLVKEIRLRLGVLERRPERTPEKLVLPVDLSEKIDRWAESIANEDVRNAMKRAAEQSLLRGPPTMPLASGPPGPRMTPIEAEPSPAPLRYGFGQRVWDRWKGTGE